MKEIIFLLLGVLIAGSVFVLEVAFIMYYLSPTELQSFNHFCWGMLVLLLVYIGIKEVLKKNKKLTN